jgi:hypothetical protein
MMKTKILLLCAGLLCACLFTQCSRSTADIETDADSENGQVEEDEWQSDPPKYLEPGSDLEKYYKSLDAGHYHRWCEGAECLPPAKTEQVNGIAGKWKLIAEINGVNGDHITDRSCEEIVWHFGSNRTLTVSVNGENDHESKYKYKSYPFCPECLVLEPTPNLKMENSAVYCDVLFETMIMYPQLKENNWPLFEVRLCFLRIE